MLQQYASDEILDMVRRRGFIATSDENWGDDRILKTASEIIRETIAPQLKTMKEGWYRTQATITLVAGQSLYDYPEEAAWNSVETIKLRRYSDGGIAGDVLLIEPSNAQLSPSTPSGIPGAFWHENTQICVFPTPDSGAATAYNFLVPMYRRSSTLVTTSSVCTVVSVSSVTLTTTAQPTYFTTNAPDIYTSGSPYIVDVWRRTTPRTRLFGAAQCTAPSTTSLAFTSLTAAQAATIKPGDIVSVKGTTIYPDMPAELNPLLVNLTIATIKLAQGDQSYQAQLERAQADTLSAIRGMSNRADGKQRKLTLYNASTVRGVVRPGYRRS